MLYLRSPMLRGDDVAQLQRELGQRGFHAGRVDGIFGPSTSSALLEFQRNAGLPTDGICGDTTVAFLRQLSPRTGSRVLATVKEMIAHPRRSQLNEARLMFGDLGGAATIVQRVSSLMSATGSSVAVADVAGQSEQAIQANRAEVDAFVGVALVPADALRISFYRTEGYESIGGRALCELVAASVDDLGLKSDVCGVRLPILRETRMPAVLLEVSALVGVEESERLATIVCDALISWFSQH